MELAMQLKVPRRVRDPDPLPEGLKQLGEYLDRLALDHGTLMLFDGPTEEPPSS